MALHALGMRIHVLVCGNQQQPTADELAVVKRYAAEVTIVPASSKLVKLLAPTPYQVAKRDPLRFAEITGGPYDYVILEGEATYPIASNSAVRQSGTKLLLRVHNDEVVYFQALARSTGNWLHKLYYYSESIKFSWLRRHVLRNIDHYMFISSKEYEKFHHAHPGKRSMFLPPPVELDRFAAFRPHARAVVFVGSLFMPNNREAIEWYLQHVHPRMLHRPEYRFVIAGNSRKQSLDWLHKFDLERVEVFDTPESLESIYEMGCLFVNPMRNGAGVKLKTIEAIQHGLPVVSTTIGCEGTGLVDGEHIAVADDPEQFVEKLDELHAREDRRAELLAASQQYIKSQYNQRQRIDEFIRSLHPLADGEGRQE
ncbi:glycosyltransferase family 4 protein [Paenibacillus kobensis]|uniref:glycosyltransferase family 4 protein n=1 Tax=Paenibacillus kobensis TaxID=59841 RepID=UPI0013E336BB|nr:glycosyltransferase family 4 protein [Paenibacillus kobensis]